MLTSSSPPALRLRGVDDLGRQLQLTRCPFRRESGQETATITAKTKHGELGDHFPQAPSPDGGMPSLDHDLRQPLTQACGSGQERLHPLACAADRRAPRNGPLPNP
jgi:hypothetical protein